MRTSHLPLALLLAPLAAFAPAAFSQVSVTVDAGTSVRVVDSRSFGLNTAVWDGTFTDPQTVTDFQAMGIQLLRFPGGSTSDGYNWQTNMNDTNNFTWATTFEQFETVAQAAGTQVIVTANYGSGTPALAAGWVQYANLTKNYGIKYWEIGNECYGSWEEDNQALPHDPYTYATRAAQYIAAMKAVDSTIKIGVVAVTGEDTYANGYESHPVMNAREGETHVGWTPVMLNTLKTLGVTPDFLIYHRYEQNNGQETDAGLLQDALTWPNDAANLRQQLTDYLGAAGASVELVVTENNSVNQDPGKQTTSVVNGLYLADSLCNVLQTEFNGWIWWDMYNGQLTNDNNSSALYGWRMYGDYGVESSAHDHYPTFYVTKLLSKFVRGGDTVVKASSNNPLLSAYAVKQASGNLNVLVINKSPTTTYSVSFGITGYSPQANATVYSYGIPQDTAAQNGSGSPDVATSTISNASANFSAMVGPYTVALYSLSIPTTKPVATAQPSSQTIANAGTVAFTFAATGAPLPTYQWFLNGTAVPSATNSTLVVSGAAAANAGTYTCVATNASGTLTSNPATLSVVSTANPGRLINLSTRAQVGTGGNILIAGFAVNGSGMIPLLVRGSGPALSPLGVPGVLPDPQLQIFSGTTVLSTNNGWAGNATIASEASAVGAFAWNSPTSHDAAVATSLASGPYTAQVAGQSGDTGVALIEVYDATPAASETPASPALINLSARTMVGTGGNILIAGFAIGGTTSVTVLIRASGPALVTFGVPGTLPDPMLTLNGGGTVLATNSAWGGNPQIAATATKVGAFNWASTGSNDSALLVTLPPGAYTAEVAGASGDTGVALVEVYRVQ